jgi:hypothetical protein
MWPTNLANQNSKRMANTGKAVYGFMPNKGIIHLGNMVHSPLPFQKN